MTKRFSKRKVHKLGWDVLTPREKGLRERSLRVTSQMRRYGYSLTRASRDVRVSPRAVRRATNAVRKIGRRWRVKFMDRIARVMAINENWREVHITVKDSRHATTIGKYQNAVRRFLETGDASILKPFKGKRVRDADGNLHTLDTDPESLYELHERREEEEFYSIYAV